MNSRKFGTKGELTEQLAQVLKALWTCKDASECSTSFKEVVERYSTQFRSSTQHDAQEFLFWLLDKVHEDLNTASKRKYKAVKNSYGRPDDVIAAETLANYVRCNNSFVQAVFRAQFRSSLTCPRCHKQSNTFDPFHCISVQLPQLSLQPMNVTLLYDNKKPKQIRMCMEIPQGSSMQMLREQLHADIRIDTKRMILTELTSTGFGRLFSDQMPISNVNVEDCVYCIEIPEKIEDSQIVLCVINIKTGDNSARFGSLFCMKINRDVSFNELQKALLKEMSPILKPEIFSYATPISEMFKIHLQEPSADPGTYLESNLEHPLLTEMIDLALSVQPSDSGPHHIKISLEWMEPEHFFSDMEDHYVDHESVSQQKEKSLTNNTLTLEHCLDHYTKAETLSAEDAWRCPQCQKYLPVVKTLGLWSLPDILVIHFKRFRQQQFKGSHASKLTTMVEFPLNGFDMSSWHLAGNNGSSSVQSSLSRKTKPLKMGTLTKNFLNEDHQYDLYAVCYHQGDTLETGHYTAACKNPYDQQWYKFDDQRVTLIKNEDVPDKIVNNEAYMLFYQRRKTYEGSECSGASAASTSSSEHWVSKLAAVPIPNVVKKEASVVKESVDIIKAEEIEVCKDLITPTLPEKFVEIENENLESSFNIDDIKAIDSDDIPEEDVSDLSESESVNKHSNNNISTEQQASPTHEIKPNDEANKINVVVEITPNSPSIQQNDKSETSSSEEDIESTSNEENLPVRELKECDRIEELMSQQAINNLLWNDTNNNNTNRHSDIGKLMISDLLSMDGIGIADEISSSSLPKNYMLKECEPMSRRIRGVSSCSKDTLMYIDQPNLLGDDDSLIDRNHWVCFKSGRFLSLTYL